MIHSFLLPHTVNSKVTKASMVGLRGLRFIVQQESGGRAPGKKWHPRPPTREHRHAREVHKVNLKLEWITFRALIAQGVQWVWRLLPVRGGYFAAVLVG